MGVGHVPFLAPSQQLGGNSQEMKEARRASGVPVWRTYLLFSMRSEDFSGVRLYNEATLPITEGSPTYWYILTSFEEETRPLARSAEEALPQGSSLCHSRLKN